MPFFMRLNCREFGMHAGVVPNYPASHGCIRMPGEKVRELFKQVEVGTLVTIVN
jgi:lipoprotein-anchoring transpeptidase ErfK/SrfK